MNEVKSLLESRTFWGAVVALAGSALSVGHYTLSAADAAQAVELISGIVSAAGGLIAICGRVAATRRIGPLTPGGGALMLLAAIGALALCGGDARAQTRPHPRPVLTGDPVRDIAAAAERTREKVADDLTAAAKQIETLLDTADAIKLATAVPSLQDTVGAACWKSFDGLSQVLKAHPLPVTLKLAADIEAMRLTAMALNQICTNPNCGQMWTDAANTASALSVAPLPFSLTSLCSRVPAIGALAAAATAPVQPAAEALGGTAATTPAGPAGK
jgi:hypothetical protein